MPTLRYEPPLWEGGGLYWVLANPQEFGQRHLALHTVEFQLSGCEEKILFQKFDGNFPAQNY